MEIAILSIIDKIYPVGCFFDTTDDGFNPNKTWGGTWEKITNSTVLMSEGSFYDEDGYLVNVGQVSGTLMHKLTTDEMPTHYHTYSRSNTATAAATGNTGSHTLTINEIPSHSHAIRNGTNGADGGSDWTVSNSGASNWYTASAGGGKGHTHSLNNHTHTISLSTVNTGGAGGQSSMSLVQPSMVVCRWHRTA